MSDFPADRLLTRDDLRGCEYISYLRFSSAGQKDGSTIDRQQIVCDGIVKHHGLVFDQALIDKALSASKGHHRTRGQLRDLLRAIVKGEDFRGKVLVIEAIDRLFREGIFDAFPVLTTIIREGGMVLVTGDMTIWNEAAINSPMAHKLIAEIDAARAFAQRLKDWAVGAHRRNRERLEDFANDPLAPKVIMPSRPPGWIIKTKDAYALCPKHTPTVRRVFELCVAGNSTLQIAKRLTADKVPVIPCPGKTHVWQATRIAALLRNRAVIGRFQPCERDGDKRVPVGREVVVYPAAVELTTWQEARTVLAARAAKLKGRKGALIPNLFTGKAFCGTCGGTLRVATGGRKHADGKSRRMLQCSRFLEANLCADSTRYDLYYYEREILTGVIAAVAAPQPKVGDGARLIGEQLASAKLAMESLVATKEELRPLMGTSPTLRADYLKTVTEIDAYAKTIAEMEIKLASAMQPSARREEVFQFMREMVLPALKGDVDARMKLRTLLAPHGFRIVGNDTPYGGMVVTLDGFRHDIYPPDHDHRLTDITDDDAA